MSGIEFKLIAILISIFMLLQAYIIRVAVGTYIFPASLLSLAWFIFTIIPLVVLYDVPINPIAILYIFGCCTAFSLSALPFRWRHAFAINSNKLIISQYLFDSKFINYCLYVTIIMAFIFSSLSMITNGVNLSSMFSNLLEASGEYAARRGHEQLEYGAIGTASICFTYMAPILGGFVSYAKKTPAKRILYLSISMAPALYFMVTQSAKLAILTAIALFLASTLLMKIYSGKLNLVKTSDIYKIILLLLILFPLLLISFLSREGYSGVGDSKETLRLLIYAISSYIFGQIYAFSDFLSFYLGMESIEVYKNDFYSLGYYSFKSIFDYFGGTKFFPPGYYHESFYYSDVFETNIFTLFRALIYDFGGAGAIMFMFVLGLFVHALFYRLLVRRYSWMACAVFIVTLVFIQMSYLSSIFVARYMYLIGVALFLILFINQRVTKSYVRQIQ